LLGCRKEKEMEEAIKLIPTWTRWALKSPENYIIFWTVFVALFFLTLTVIDFISKRRKK